jgi:polyphosphate kinase 2 (PPK2 family)
MSKKQSTKIKKTNYKETLRLLQIELVKLQKHIIKKIGRAHV